MLLSLATDKQIQILFLLILELPAFFSKGVLFLSYLMITDTI